MRQLYNRLWEDLDMHRQERVMLRGSSWWRSTCKSSWGRWNRKIQCQAKRDLKFILNSNCNRTIPQLFIINRFHLKSMCLTNNSCQTLMPEALNTSSTSRDSQRTISALHRDQLVSYMQSRMDRWAEGIAKERQDSLTFSINSRILSMKISSRLRPQVEELICIQ